MVALITDPSLEKRLIAQRKASGADQYDEIWEGVYVMAPLADDQHQNLVNEITTVLTLVIAWPGLGKVRPGINVSDRKDDWTENHRCPDVAVFLNDTKAENCGTHWYGGPDFAVEITSPGDKTASKIPFYSGIGTRELLIVNRAPWSIQLFRLQEGHLVEVGGSDPSRPEVLVSEVLPLSWRLISEEGRPVIEMARHDGSETWSVETETDGT